MLTGSIVALITPFNLDNSINYDELARLCDFHIKNKTDGLLLLGTTAEAESLSIEEKRNLVDFVISHTKNQIGIMVGIISNITEEVVELSKQFKDLAFDSYLVITPYYNKTNESGLIKHFNYIADHVDKPIVLYNVPKRTGMSMSFEMIQALSYHKNIIGIKEASGDMKFQMKLSSLAREDFALYSGDDFTAYIANLIGFAGIISVIGNAFPKETKEMLDNTKDAKDKYFFLLPLLEIMYQEVSPIGIKYVMYLLGWNTFKYRRPLDEPSKELKRKLEAQILTFL